MTTKRRLSVAVAAVAACLLGVASFAWACGPQPYIGLDPSSGGSGTVVSVVGQNFQDGTVELRWNSASGHLLGTANGPQFSTQVTIPQAADGSYVIMGIQYAANGDFKGQPGRATFQVKSAQQEAPPEDVEPSRPEEGDGQSREPRSEPRDARNQDRATSTEPAGSGARPDPVDDDASDAGSAAGPAASDDVVAEERGDRAREVTRRKAPSADPLPVRGAPDRRVSEASASADLWSGLDPVTGSAPRLGGGVPSREPGWQAVVGIVALGLGTALAFAGALIATVRRRRLRARVEDA